MRSVNGQQRQAMRTLQGRSVHVSLSDGSRLDDVFLVSASRSRIWVFLNGEDTFIPVKDVVDVWEARRSRAA